MKSVNIIGVGVPSLVPFPHLPTAPTNNSNDNKCEQCGISLGNVMGYVMGYVCSRSDCPTFSRVLCGVPT